jgi:hypothetical protein
LAGQFLPAHALKIDIDKDATFRRRCGDERERLPALNFKEGSP